MWVFSIAESLLSFTFMTYAYQYVGYTLITNYFKNIRSHSCFYGFCFWELSWFSHGKAKKYCILELAKGGSVIILKYEIQLACSPYERPSLQGERLYLSHIPGKLKRLYPTPAPSSLRELEGQGDEEKVKKHL